MSANLPLLALKEDDVKKMLVAQTHIGARNCDPNTERYTFKRKQQDGIYVINLGKTWEKLMLAARVIVAIENPQDVVVVSARPFGTRAVFKYAQHTQAQYIAGRYTPGTFTNQIQRKFLEPRLLIVTDPRTDHQPVKEASYVNIPVIAFVDTDSPLEHIDIAIPCNNKSANSIALMYWLLAREVQRMRGTLQRNQQWDQPVDLFIYRDPEEAEKQAADQKEAKEDQDVVQDAPKSDNWEETQGGDQGFQATGQPATQNWQPPVRVAGSGWDTTTTS
jgi:small subunit ribosomal protein SAe